MTTAEELLARLRTIEGVAAVFDTDAETYSAQASPFLVLQHISGVPAHAIDGTLHTTEERWQVSVRGRNLHRVRTVAQAVSDSLDGYHSDAIKWVAYESWPGTIQEGSGTAREFHAPVDFTVTT